VGLVVSRPAIQSDDLALAPLSASGPCWRVHGCACSRPYQSLDWCRSWELSDRARRGHPNGGQVRLGYRYIMKPHQGHWEIDADEAALVRRIFEMCLAGMPTRAIARQLTVDKDPDTSGSAAEQWGQEAHRRGRLDLHQRPSNSPQRDVYGTCVLWSQAATHKNHLSARRPGGMDSRRGASHKQQQDLASIHGAIPP
jgi:hypothetical protein